MQNIKNDKTALMADIVADAVLDARGESCPYPFIRTKWLMEQIASGEVLKVIVNDPEALQNIDSLTKKSGDRILRIENEGDTHIIYVKKEQMESHEKRKT